MRLLRSVMICLASVLSLGTSALANEPDDTPWDLRGTDIDGKPLTIEDLIARDQRSIIENTDITPPGQHDQDIRLGHGGAEFENDRLTPTLPNEIYDAPARAPDLAIRPVDSAPETPSVPPTLAMRRLDSSQGTDPLVAPAVQPGEADGDHAPGTGPTPQPVEAMAAPRRDVAPVGPPYLNPTESALPINSKPVGEAPPTAEPSRTPAAPVGTPTPVAPATAPAEAARPAQPAISSPAATALRTPPPVQSTVAKEPYDPHAPPPLAVPSEPVAEATVAVNGKLYLPMRRYFEVRSAVTLANFDEADRAVLRDFYNTTVGEALWVTRGGYNSAAISLIEEIKKADTWGLASDDFVIPGLSRIGGGDFNYEDLIEAEVRLSLVAMQYARYARGDRIFNPTEQLSAYIDRKPQLIDRPKLLLALAGAADKGSYLRSLQPQHPQFLRLRDKLVALRTAQAKGAEPERIKSGPNISPGKSHGHVALVRRSLGVIDAPTKPNGEAADDEYYDAALARAVVQFKKRQEIEPASTTITGELRQALNARRMLDEQQILANMEQWRWMPQELGRTYVWVNVPEFLVRVKKEEQILHEERIIAGRVNMQTPIFSNTLRTVVFQPSWNVPESIKVNEFLPKLRDGGNPIESQGLRMERNGREVDAWDIDWQTQDIRKYHVYQPPGGGNVLGVVKFLFPNKHSVYLHDTPTKRLFNEKVRTFSHGCMRVRNPVRLAEVVMAEDKGWDKEKVDDLISSGPEENDVALDTPMPVHVTYFTLWIGDDGEVQTFDDVYGHEQRIKLGLHGRWDDIDKPRDHLLPDENSGVIATSRDDWGDEEGEPPPRRTRRTRDSRTAYEPPPRQVQLTQPPPSYKQVYPKKKNGSAIQELFSNILKVP